MGLSSLAVPELLEDETKVKNLNLLTKVKFSRKNFHGLIVSMALFSVPSFADVAVYGDEDSDTRLNFMLEISAASFGGSNSWFGESESFLGDDTENWAESSAELGFNGETVIGSGAVFGEVTGLQTRTYGDDASGLTIGLDDPSEFRVEQAHLGWRSGDTFQSLGEDAITVKAGRFDYMVGTGLLIADGAGDGGERGGWWLGTRKAFRDSFLATLKTGNWLVEGFHLENEDRNGSKPGKADGFNTEYDFSSDLKLGLLWMDASSNDESTRDFDATSLRADWMMVDNFTLSGEFVTQDANDGAEPEGWYLKAAYQWAKVKWSPELSYRYSHFDGDDLATPENEGFRTAAYGFSDYGTWYQGEITGNYPLGNDNLDTHMLRVMMMPMATVTLNVIYYNFTLDEKNIFGTPVTSDEWGDEFDVSVDWEIDDHLYLIGVVAILSPGEAAKQWTGGDKDWVYNMLYLSYAL